MVRRSKQPRDDVRLALGAGRPRARCPCSWRPTSRSSAGAPEVRRRSPRRACRRPAAAAVSGGAATCPFALLLAALAVLLFGLARPQATLARSRVSGTVLLVFDVSNSMGADDVEPTRLAAAQDAGPALRRRPADVDRHRRRRLRRRGAAHPAADGRPRRGAGRDRPADDGRRHVARSGDPRRAEHDHRQAGRPPGPRGAGPADLGYFASATIVLFSDGEDTGGPDPIAVAQLAADAGVHIDTIGIGTADGATVDGRRLPGGHRARRASLPRRRGTSPAAPTTGATRRRGSSR